MRRTGPGVHPGPVLPSTGSHKEFPLAIGCRLTHHLEVGLHTLFVGEIVDVLADESALAPDGKLDLASLSALLYAPDQKAYYGVGPRLADAFSVGRRFQKK